MEKQMATHSSILSWKIPWTEEPAGLQSIGLQRMTEHISCILFKGRITGSYVNSVLNLLRNCQIVFQGG